MITRNPTEVAECGCPYDPAYDEGSLGWHLRENHIPELIDGMSRDLDSLATDLHSLKVALQRRTDIYDATDEILGPQLDDHLPRTLDEAFRPGSGHAD